VLQPSFHPCKRIPVAACNIIEERVQIRQAREASWLEAQQAEEAKTEEQWVELEEYAAIEELDDDEIDEEVEEVSEDYEVDEISIDD